MQTGQNDPTTLPGPRESVELGVSAATIDTLLAASQEYGPIVAFNDAARGSTVFVNSADHVNALLVRQHRRLNKGTDFERVRMLLGNGIIVNDGELWRRHRRALQPAFTRRRIGAHIEAIDAISSELAAEWQAAAASGETVDINTATSRYALDVILNAIFGADHAARFRDRANNPFRFLSEEFARDLRAVTRLRAARDDIREIMEARRSESRRQHDFLDELLFGDAATEAGLTDKEIVDEVMTLVVAGYETSATTLSFAWYELSRRPELAARLTEELQAAESQAEASLAWLERIPLTLATLRETLRWYPPVWLFSRRTMAATEMLDITLPPATTLMLSPYLLHRADTYWAAPDRFDPERFVASGENPAYIPFSLGPRRCIGEYFAMLEMARHLRALLPRFAVEPAGPALTRFSFGINLRPGEPIAVSLRPRANGHV